MHDRVLITAAMLLLAGCAAAPVEQVSVPAPEPVVVQAPPVPDTRPGSDALLYNLLVGEIAGQRQQYGVSAAHYIAAARRTRDLGLARRAAQIAIYAREFDLAIEAAALWSELDPEESDPYQVLAALHLQRGDQAAASEPLRRLLERKQFTSSDDYLALARFFHHGTDHRPLFAMMEEVIRQRPDDPDALHAFVVIAIRMGELEKAAQQSVRLVSLQPDRPKVALLHAQLLNVSDRAAEGARFLADYVTAHPDVFETRLALARLLVDQGQTEQALAHFVHLHRADPEHADVLFALALVELQEGLTDAAEGHLRALVALEPDADRGRYYLGRVHEQKERFESAVEAYRSVTSAQYRHEAVTRTARSLGKLGRLDEALEMVHGVGPVAEEQQVELIVLEVDLLLHAEEAARAVEVATTALGTFPDNIDLLFSLGMAYEKLDDLPAMESHMRRLLALEPHNAHALNALGYTYADRGIRLDEAREMVLRAHQLQPDNPYILDSMGWVEYRFGRYDSAIDYLKRALDIMPDPEIYAHLGEVLWVMGEVAEARAVLHRGLVETPDDHRILGVMRRFDL